MQAKKLFTTNDASGTTGNPYAKIINEVGLLHYIQQLPQNGSKS